MKLGIFAARSNDLCQLGLLVALSLGGCDSDSVAPAMSLPSAPLAGSTAFTASTVAGAGRPAAASVSPSALPMAATPTIPAGAPAQAPSASPPSAATPAGPQMPGQQLQPLTAVTRNVMRNGGNWALPVLLLNDGSASLHVDGPSIKAPLEDRVDNPDNWSEWRREGDGYEYLSSSGSWKELGRREPAPLPKGHTLDLPYYTVTTISGVDSTLVRSSVFEFFVDSTFSSSRSVNAWSDHTPVSTLAADSHGTYEIDGYLLTLRFANGQTEEHGLVSYGGDEWMIWIDGTVYCHLLDGQPECSSK